MKNKDHLPGIKTWLIIKGTFKNHTAELIVMYENISFKIKDKTKLMSNATSPFSSVQFSCSVASDSLWPHEPQHVRPPSPSNPCPLSRWCHPTISSSVIPFSSCHQSFPASGSFQMSQLFAKEVAKVLGFQLQYQSCQWTPRTDLL